jgi:hypothetical protein
MIPIRRELQIYVSIVHGIIHMPHRTFQSVDRPCLKLFESDLCGRREDVVIQSMFIVLLLILCLRKLPLLVVDVCTPFGVYARIIVADHGVCRVVVSLENCGTMLAMRRVKWNANAWTL